MPKTPSYRKRSGYNQAIVTLTDSKTKRRRDYWLGEFNTPESREHYHRLIAAWEANGRRHPGVPPQVIPPIGSVVYETWQDEVSPPMRYQVTRVMDGVKTSFRCSRRLVGGSIAFLFFATDECMGGIKHFGSEQQVVATQ